MSDAYYWHDPEAFEFVLSRNDVDTVALEQYREVLASCPPKTELPKWLGDCGTMQCQFLLDFGSFRDLQRQRSVTQRMPLLTTDIGFHPWYLEELTPELRREAEDLLASQQVRINALRVSKEVEQYYIPMGYLTANSFSGDLPAMTYITELRVTRFVYPTLRIQAARMADALQLAFGETGYVLHLDPEPDRFDVKRGEHDIVKQTA